MIEHKNISPLLDGFSLGNPVGDHFGISCYPAIRENSERKYIVKIISVPASQAQLDALLITGAYKDAGEAAEYFRSQAEEILKEAELLETLSQENGFVPFEDAQMEPMEKGRIGYEVCFLSGFRLSLNRYMHRKTISHLDAVNLGIDICEALTAARKAGMLYIALKPANIFITAKKDFRIGDLGFVSLDSLRFTAMPEKYRSPYTAPELLDDLNTLNTTADTYALGMILYQIFNNGQLPQDLSKELPDPAAADGDMALILKKACSPNIENRWESPEQMGQALRAYLQGGTVDDSPILPPLPGRAPDRTVRLFDIAAAAKEAEEAGKEAEAPASEAAETQSSSEETPVAETNPEPVQEPAAEAPAEEASAAEPDPDLPETESVSLPEPEAEAVPLPELEADTAAPPDEPPAADPVAEELAQAVASHFESLTAAAEPAPAETVMTGQQLDSELKELNHILRPEPPKKKKRKKEPNVTPVVIKPKKKHNIIKTLVILLLLVMLFAAGIWGYLFYTREYIQPIRDMQIGGSNSQMLVLVDSDVTDGLLTAVCTDAYGHSQRQTVRGGQAVFSDLSPDSLYKVNLEISGFRKLTGVTSGIFTTESVTNVASFTVAMGNINGSVILNLSTEGHEPEQWHVVYTAPGEPELGHTFSGHNTTINNLVLGKEYTFSLQTGDHKDVVGQTAVAFTPAAIVKAQDLSVLSCTDGVLKVVWNAPKDSDGTIWRARCSGDNYEQVVETTDTIASFEGIDATASYGVEVTAIGMTQSESVRVSANPITLTDFRVNQENPMTMNVSWDYSGAAPADGWVLEYTIDDGYLPTAVRCSTPSAVVESPIPDAVYHFKVLTTTDTSVFNGLHEVQSSPASYYTGHGMTANCMSVKMLLDTPETEGWTYESTIRLGIFPKSTFSPSDRISAVLFSSIGFYLGTQNDDIIHVMFVYRDDAGNVVTELIGETDRDWYQLWFDEDYHYCELDVPTTPMKPGNYNLTIYFNGLQAASTNLTVN